jgi:hypothetical protein
MENPFEDFPVPNQIIGERCALFTRGMGTTLMFSEGGRKWVEKARALVVKRTSNKAQINKYLSQLKIRLPLVHPQAIFIDFDHDFHTLLIFPKGMNEEQIIMDLEDHGGKMVPLTIWIALIASMSWVESPIPVRESIGSLQQLVYEESVLKTSTLEWIRHGASEDPKYTNRWVENIIRHGEFPSEKHLSPGAAAGVIWIVARLLWDKDEIRNTAEALTKKSEWLVSCLGTLMMMITGGPVRFRGCEVKPRIFLDKDYPFLFLDMWFWRACIQTVAISPGREVIEHLFPRGIPNLIGEDYLKKIIAPISLESVTAIIYEAYERRVYPTPEEGRGYVIDIPFEPIREIFTECRIFHLKSRESPHDMVYCILDGPYGGVWYALLMNEDHMAFIWKNNHSSFRVIATMVVGIWRDLIGEGEEVFPAYYEQAEEEEPANNRPRPYKSSSKNSERVVYLPRSRYVRWGTPKERNFILRRARRGSMIEAKAINLTRSGRKPSLKQIRLAEEYGITLPAGWTFRKEHWRGPRLEEGEEERPKVIKCRGLSTVAYLLGDLLKGE